MIKLFTLVTLASISFGASAQTCYVDMVNRYNQVVRSFTAYDNNDSCKEGMKQCRLTIRREPHLGGVDCVRDQGQSPYPNPYPNPNPNPYPNPNPNPYPQPDQGYPHYIIVGEEVYNVNNNRYAEVISQDYNGKFVLRYRDNGAVGTGWSRDDLAPLRGCDQRICVRDQIYNVNNNRYATVVGLQMGGRFVLKYQDNGATGDGWSRDDIAVMNGCQLSLCVGSRVINLQNRRYARVIALQSGNRFVLKYDDNGATGDGWSISDVAPIR